MAEDEAFQGFRPNTQAIKLLGDEQKSVLYDLSGPQGVSRREGSVSFWIRRDAKDPRRETLWLAGRGPTGEISPQESMVWTDLTSTGRLQFFIENGNSDVLLSSTRSLTDDQWHHIVISWGPGTVALYVDGHQVARDKEPRTLQDGTFSGRFVRFGKPSGQQAQLGSNSYSGWVDEIALWNRPLTAAEVKQQFQSARGSGEP